MILTNPLIFDNNGLTIGNTYEYKVEFYNIVNKITEIIIGNIIIDSERYIIIDDKLFPELIKGKYKCKLYIDNELFCTFIGLKELSILDKYTYEDKKTKYVYGG